MKAKFNIESVQTELGKVKVSVDELYVSFEVDGIRPLVLNENEIIRLMKLFECNTGRAFGFSSFLNLIKRKLEEEENGCD